MGVEAGVHEDSSESENEYIWLEGNRVNECSICHKVISYRNLPKHIRSKHPGTVVPRKPYAVTTRQKGRLPQKPCPHCHKEFASVRHHLKNCRSRAIEIPNLTSESD